MIKDKKLKIISKPTCDGNNEIIAFYDQSSKMFIVPPRYSSDESYKTATLVSHFDKCLQNGTQTTMFQMCLGIKDFKSLWDEIKNDIKPKFKTGEQVIKYNKYSPEIWIFGEVVGFQKVCGIDKGISEFCVNRRFIHDITNETYTKPESQFMPISELDECKEARKIINSAARELKKSGIVGAFFIHRGKAYRF